MGQYEANREFTEESIRKYNSLISEDDADVIDKHLGLKYLMNLCAKAGPFIQEGEVRYTDLFKEYFNKSIYSLKFDDEYVLTPEDFSKIAYYSHVSGFDEEDDAEIRKVYRNVYDGVT